MSSFSKLVVVIIAGLASVVLAHGGSNHDHPPSAEPVTDTSIPPAASSYSPPVIKVGGIADQAAPPSFNFAVPQAPPLKQIQNQIATPKNILEDVAPKKPWAQATENQTGMIETGQARTDATRDIMRNVLLQKQQDRVERLREAR